MLDVVAQDPAERRVEEVGSGVVTADGRPTIGVDGGSDHAAYLQGPVYHLDVVLVQAVERQRGVYHPRSAGPRYKRPGVADLATGLGVERGAVQHDHSTVGEQDRGVGLFLLPSHKLGGTVGLQHRPEVAGGRRASCLLAGRPGPLLLVGHGDPEALQVDLDAPFGGDLFGQFQGEPVGVVQLEGHVAVQPAALAYPVQGVVEDGQSGP